MDWVEAEKAYEEETPVTTKVGPSGFRGKIIALGMNTCTIETNTDKQYRLRNIPVAKVSLAEN